MSPNTVKKLLDEGKTSDEIRDILIQDSVLTTKRNSLDRKRESVKKEYEEKIKIIESEFRELKVNCPHYEKTYYPDASGNNDSYTACDLCGKELPR